MAHRHFGIEVRQEDECPVCLDLGATSRGDAKEQARLVTDVIVEIRDNDEPTVPIFLEQEGGEPVRVDPDQFKKVEIVEFTED
jgi:hypothetical protein